MSITALLVGLTAAVCLTEAISLTVHLSSGAGFLLGVAAGIVCSLLAHIGLDR